MATVESYTQKIMAEDVVDEVYIVSPIDAPIAAMSKTTRATGKIHQWSEDALAAPAKNAQVEGADAPAATFVAVADKQNFTQIMSSSAEVSGTVEEHDKYGRESEMSFQLEKKYGELANDEEFAICGTGVQAGTVGTNAVAREMTCIQAQIAAGNTIDATASGTAVALEWNLLEANEAAYAAGGQPSYMFIPPKVGNIVAAFANAAGRERDFGTGTTITNTVDLYVGPHGQLDVVMDRNLNADDILLLDFNYLATPVFRTTRDWPIAKVGDKDTRQILRESTYAVLNEESQARVENVQVATIIAALKA